MLRSLVVIFRKQSIAISTNNNLSISHSLSAHNTLHPGTTRVFLCSASLYFDIFVRTHSWGATKNVCISLPQGKITRTDSSKLHI